ncbi:MAG: hypothetical protein ACRD22_00715, partial [Terriglobia bacterium]
SPPVPIATTPSRSAIPSPEYVSPLCLRSREGGSGGGFLTLRSSCDPERRLPAGFRSVRRPGGGRDPVESSIPPVGRDSMSYWITRD